MRGRAVKARQSQKIPQRATRNEGDEVARTTHTGKRGGVANKTANLGQDLTGQEDEERRMTSLR